MATNDFKPFAIGSNANVMTQSDYEALPALSSGFQAGKAASAQVNKAIRQGTVMASTLAQFIANSSGTDVLDNGDAAALLVGLEAAISAFSSGRLINIQVIKSSQNFTKTKGAVNGRVMIIGAGGGGGGCPATDSSQQATAGGGQSGAYADVWLQLPDTAYVTIGTGGTAGTKAPTGGGNGGASSFGSLITCPGGNGGGAGAAAVASAAVIGNTADGSTPTITTNSTILSSLPCRSGEMQAIAIGIYAAQVRGGDGGSSPFGLGGKAGRGAAGNTGTGYGVGGGGCSQIYQNQGDIGGKGVDGICIVLEYV